MGIGGMCGAVWLVLAMSASVASADTSADSLVAEGEQLGKAGDFEGALAKFRQAETIEPRAVHDCWIALAQRRLRRWTSARFHLDRCKQRAGGTAPVSWFRTVADEVQAGLDDGGFEPVEIATEPPGATVVIREIAGERWTSPVTLYLSGETRTVSVSLNGYRTLTRTVSIPGQHEHEIELERGRPISTEGGGGSDRAAASAQSSATGPWFLIGTGAAAGAIGGVFHYTGYRARTRATDKPDQYDEEVDRLRRDRAIALSLYGVGAATIGTGLYLLVRNSKTRDHAIVSVGASRNGGAIWIGGRF